MVISHHSVSAGRSLKQFRLADPQLLSGSLVQTNAPQTGERNRSWHRSHHSLPPSSSLLATQGRALFARKTSHSGQLKANQQLSGRLSATDNRYPQEQGSFADEYTLSGFGAGQRVRIDLKSNQFDAYLELTNTKTGQTLWSNDDRSYDTHDASIIFTVKPSVNYGLRVTSYNKGEKGSYTLSNRNPPDPTPVFSYDYGYGLVDAAKAVASALSLRQMNTNWNAFDNVPDMGGNQWNLDLVKAQEVWAQGFTGQGITVAVLDTGVDYTHPDLQDNIWQNPGEIASNGIDDDRNGYIDDTRGWNFVDMDSNDPMDTDRHGTHVAGSIAATSNGFGVTGVAYSSKIMPIKVIGGFDDRSFTRFDNNVAAGIRYAVESGARVINMSLGNYPGDPAMVQTKAALKYAVQSGVVPVMASGNERQTYGTKRPIQPALFAESGLGVAVGAVNRRRQVADFSNPAGNKPLNFLVAPGVTVRSTVPNNGYEQAGWSGTSMAAPHVAGVVALMLSANPSLTVSDVEIILQDTADPFGVRDLR
jgi:subtilisin family serine protease